MKQSRREFVVAGTGVATAVVAGCLGQATNGLGSGADNGDGSGDGSDCDPIDLPLIDEPPHDPERPPPPEDIGDEWDDQYLGTGMDDDSDLSFEGIDLRFRESPVSPVAADGGSVFYAELLTTRAEFDELVEPVGEDSTDRADGIDFENKAVVVVLSGFGSSSVRHEWVRVEHHCREANLHGYDVRPYIQTSDYVPRVSGVIVDKPEGGFERAWVSLTVGEDTRANFHTDDDVQVVTDDDNDDGSKPSHGSVSRVEVVPATRESDGHWYSDRQEDVGVVVRFDDEDELRAVIDGHEDVDRFVDETDFDSDAVCYLESVGPNACYRTIDVHDVRIVASDDAYTVRGGATVVDSSDDGVGCAQVVTYPGVLLRVESDVDVRGGRFRIVDGWNNGETVEAVPVTELDQD